MPKAGTRRALDAGQRARLHLQFATLERAGVTPAQALEALDCEGEVAVRVRAARGFLAQGQSWAAAGHLSGLFTPLEAAVIAAVASGGSPAFAHQRLSEQAQRSAQAQSTLRTRLIPPAFLVLAALLILPLPALVAGSLGPGAYALRVMMAALLAGGAWALIDPRARPQATVGPQPGRLRFEALVLGLPLVGAWLTRIQAQRFVEHLAWLLECGLPAVDAVRLAATTVSFGAIRSDFEAALPALQRGQSLQRAAVYWSAVTDPALAGVLASGEGSGRLPEALQRHAAAEAAALQSRIDDLTTWLPRAVYLVVAVALAWQLIRGFAAFLPRGLG